MRKKSVCKVDGCDRYVFGHGFCNMHYKRWKKTGNPGQATTIIRTDCPVEGCLKEHVAFGFCGGHYQQYKKYQKVPTKLLKDPSALKPLCPRLFCKKTVLTKGLCGKHYGVMSLYQKYQPGFTWENYDSIWTSQKGRCAVCKTELTWDSKKTHVDHDHKHQKIRGLLCSICNQGLGSFRDDITLLTSAIKYLKKHSNQQHQRSLKVETMSQQKAFAFSILKE